MLPLYLVAVLPPEPVFTETWALKQEVHRLTGSRNAVRLPPHITLLPPFRAPAAFEADYLAALAEFAITESPFDVALDGFAWFGNRTLFVHVARAEALKAFHTRLVNWCTEHLPQVPLESRPFTPHLTLATRDLPPAQAPELRQLFAERQYEATFAVAGLTLFRHDGQQWQPQPTIGLGGSAPL
jgi:2'-5' RNA ligase